MFFENTLSQALITAVEESDMTELMKLHQRPSLNVNILVSENTKTTLLHSAVEKGILEIVVLLLTRRPQLDCFDDLGRTPLALAAYHGYKDIVLALLNAGCDVNAAGFLNIHRNIPTISGITALHSAALRGDISIINLLIKYGANINAIQIQKNNAVLRPDEITAIYAGHQMDAQLTPLDLAELKENRRAAKWLRDYGAKTAQEIERTPPLQTSSCCSIM